MKVGKKKEVLFVITISTWAKCYKHTHTHTDTLDITLHYMTKEKESVYERVVYDISGGKYRYALEKRVIMQENERMNE